MAVKKKTRPRVEKPDKIKPMSKRPRHSRILLYSHPGVGKSRLVGSTQEVGKLLVLNADGPDGPEPMREFGDPDVWTMSRLKDLDESLQYLRHGGTKEYDWVWLDSWSIFEELAMDDIMESLIRGTVKGRRAAPDRNVALPDKPEYLLRQNSLGQWVRHMRGLPINFGITAHVMSMGSEEDDDEGTAQYMPSIQGKRGEVSAKTCGYFGIVGRLYIVRKKVKLKGGGSKVKSKRVLQVQPSAKWYAKDRLSHGRLGDEMEDPLMSDIVKAINGRKT